MRKSGDTDFYEYSRSQKQWEHQDGVALSDTERRVLWLSAQGMSADGIADIICKSVDSVKTYKKRLFKELGVSCIPEALIFAINNRLL